MINLFKHRQPKIKTLNISPNQTVYVKLFTPGGFVIYSNRKYSEIKENIQNCRVVEVATREPGVLYIDACI